MPWEFLAPMVVSVVFILTVGGVILLRPLSGRLAELLDAMTQERRQEPGLERDLERIQRALERIEDRVDLLEERQDFTEELLKGGRGKERGRIEASRSETRREG